MNTGETRSTPMVLGVASLCVLNIVPVLVPYSIRWLEFRSQFRGHEGTALLVAGVCVALAIGIYLGEFNYLALWVNVSSRLRFRLPIFFGLTVLVGIVYSLFKSTLIPNNNGLDTLARCIGGNIVSAIAIFTGLAFGKRQIRMVSVSEDSEGSQHAGATIAQSLYLITLVAITLWARPVEGKFDESWWQATIWYLGAGSFNGLIVIGTLSIATFVKRAWAQGLLACLLVATIVGVSMSVFERGWNATVPLIFLNLGVVLVPLIALRIARKLGYDIQCFDRKREEVVEHPFHGDDAAKEPNR